MSTACQEGGLGNGGRPGAGRGRASNADGRLGGQIGSRRGSAYRSMKRPRWHRRACTFRTYNEPWPNAAHGCVVEYCGRPKMAYYYAKESYPALDISAVYPSLLVAPGKPFRVPVFVSSDLAVELPGYASRYCIYNTAGDRFAEETSNLNILPENSTKAMDVTWVPPAFIADPCRREWRDKPAACRRQLFPAGRSEASRRPWLGSSKARSDGVVSARLLPVPHGAPRFSQRPSHTGRSAQVPLRRKAED